MSPIYQIYNSGSIQQRTAPNRLSDFHTTSSSVHVVGYDSEGTWEHFSSGHGFLPVKVFFGHSALTHADTLMAFFFEAVCVIRSLLSGDGKSSHRVFDSIVKRVCVCDNQVHLNSIDLSAGSFSSKRQFTSPCLLLNRMSC